MTKLYDKLCDILEEMERKDKLSASDLQVIDWATHAKKSMLAIENMEGSSHDSRRRDSMGRYSRDDYSSRYSRDGGREEYVEQLRRMVETAPDEKTRQSIQRMIREID